MNLSLNQIANLIHYFGITIEKSELYEGEDLWFATASKRVNQLINSSEKELYFDSEEEALSWVLAEIKRQSIGGLIATQVVLSNEIEFDVVEK